VEAGVRGLERRRGPGASAGGGRRGLGQHYREQPSRGAALRGKKERGIGVLSVGRSSETAGKTTLRRKGTNQNALEITSRP